VIIKHLTAHEHAGRKDEKQMASQQSVGMRSVLLLVCGAMSLASLAGAARHAEEAESVVHAQAAAHPEPLAIGSPAPDFTLPAVDGKTYSLSTFKDSKVLAVIFTAVHCPTAEVYEGRIKQLVSHYQKRGVAFVAIQPNNAKALRLDEMGYTDLGDSLEDMKIRAEYRQFNFPFLYDGETQDISKKYGPVATPHIFVFDAERKLRYHGRIDSNPREALAKVPDARNALDAVLAGTQVAVEKTPAIGCSVKWLDKKASHDAEEASFAKEPVNLEKVSVADMKALAANNTGKTLLVNFWATWCAPCVEEFPDLMATWRMYRKRPFQLVTVAVNYPDEEKAVRTFLESQKASARNLMPSIMEPSDIVTALDKDWNGGVPYSMIIAPGGKVLYRSSGRVNILETRRLILKSFPDDDYVGQNAYWNSK
jgi:thiol-disulfide isomerase/thioredoxin